MRSILIFVVLAFYLYTGSYVRAQQATATGIYDPTIYPLYPYDPLPTQPVCYGQYEVYLGQGEAPNCDQHCATLCQPCGVVYKRPPFGCYCAPGYCRNENSVCIPIHESEACNTCDIDKE